MKSFIKIILVLLFFAASAFAMDTPIIIGGNQVPAITGTAYTCPIAYNPAWGATEAALRLVIPTAGTLYNLQVADSGSGSGNYTYTLYKNGSPTSLTCNDSAADCKDITHTVTVSPGDTISLQVVANSPDAIYLNWQGTLMFNSNTSAESLVMGGSASNIAANYYPIQSVSAGNATLNLTQSTMPTAGSIDHLYIDSQNAPGAGTGWTVTVYKNGSATSLTTSITDAAKANSDLTHSVSFVAGDLINIGVTFSGSPASSPVRWGVRWLPTTDGESIQLYGNLSTGTATSTQYSGVSDGIAGAFNATETNRLQMIQSCTVKKLYLDVVSAPGSDNAITLTVMAKQTPSSITCVINTGGNTCNDTTHSYSASRGDTIDIKAVKVSAPTGNGTHLGLVTFIDPPTPTPTATPTPTNTPTPTPAAVGGQTLPLLGVG